MANQAILNPNRAFDANGYTSPGARAFFYQTGTLTAVNVYSDEAGTIIAANPVVADANGTFPQRFVTEAVKVVIQTIEGATLDTLDPAPTVQALGSAASAVAFFPTLFIPDINVQAAIQRVDGNWRVATDALTAGKQDADADLTAFAALASTGGMLVKLGPNSYAVRTLTQAAGVTITNADGVAGNPTFSAAGGPGAQFNYESAAAPASFASAGTFTALIINATKKSGLGISLAANQLTFAAAGTYFIDATTLWRNTSGAARLGAIRIRNTTTSVTGVMGMGVNAPAGTAGQIDLSGEITVAAGNALELQGLSDGALLGNGGEHDLGAEINIYTMIKIWRVS